MRILIAEDDLMSSKLLQKLLSSYGECDVVKDGLEALDAFQEASAENQPYDLICLDIMMPKMDGHSVLHRIRQLEDKRLIDDNQRVKVVMTTALSDRKNVTRAAMGKCEGYLVKPIGKDNFIWVNPRLCRGTHRV